MLVVEDDMELGHDLVAYLQCEGFRVALVSDVPTARRTLCDTAFDLCLLDICLPGQSGKVLCRALADDAKISTLIMSAQAETDTIVTMLELGAEDYIVKPFAFEELRARMRVALRRRGSAHVPPNAPMTQIGPWAMEARHRRLRHTEGFVVAMTPSETEVLRFLAGSPGTTFSREDILAVARTRQHAGSDDRAVDNLVRRLRRKIEADPANPVFLVTEWGRGYRLNI